MGYHKNLLFKAWDDTEHSIITKICKKCGEEFIQEYTRTTNWDGTHDTDIDVIKDCKCGERKGY